MKAKKIIVGLLLFIIGILLGVGGTYTYFNNAKMTKNEVKNTVKKSKECPKTICPTCSNITVDSLYKTYLENLSKRNYVMDAQIPNYDLVKFNEEDYYPSDYYLGTDNIIYARIGNFNANGITLIPGFSGDDARSGQGFKTNITDVILLKNAGNNIYALKKDGSFGTITTDYKGNFTFNKIEVNNVIDVIEEDINSAKKTISVIKYDGEVQVIG